MFILSFEKLGLCSTQKNIHEAIRFINEDLYKGAKIYQAMENTFLITNKFPEGHMYPSGTFVFKTYLGEREYFFNDLIDEENFKLSYNKFRLLNSPGRIGLYSGLCSADFCLKPYKALLSSLQFNYTELSDKDIREGILKSFQLLIVPGGPDAGESYYSGLGEKGMEEIRSFIKNGGKYLGSCSGAYLPLSASKDSEENRMWLNVVKATEDYGLNYQRTGAGLVRINLSETNPITFGIAYGKNPMIDVIYWEGPIFNVDLSNATSTMKEPLRGKVAILGSYESFIASGIQPPSFDLSINPITKDMMMWTNPLTLERFNKYMLNRPAIIYSNYFKGKLILFSFHPEFGYGISNYEEDINHLFILNSIYELFSS